MGITLTVIDHHQNDTEFLKKFKNITLIKGSTVEEFYKNARDTVNRDFDLVVSDSDPDGATSAGIYYLNRKIKPHFKCMRDPLTPALLKELESQGIKSILTLDYFSWIYSSLDYFDQVIIINPVLVNLPNINTSELTYQILPLRDTFSRDISTLGTVCDYRIDTAFEKIKATILDYPDLFPALLILLEQGKLDKYTIWDSAFQELTDALWAPYILKGDQGTQELVYKILQNGPFTFRELLGSSSNETVHYLQEHLKKYQQILRKELEIFEKIKKIEGIFLTYQIQNPEVKFTSKFSSLVCNKYPDKVVILKSKSTDGTYKYSLRRRTLNLNLGLIAREVVTFLGYPQAGGHPEAAGAAFIPDAEKFEKHLKEKITAYLKISPVS